MTEERRRERFDVEEWEFGFLQNCGGTGRTTGTGGAGPGGAGSGLVAELAAGVGTAFLKDWVGGTPGAA